MQTGFCFCLHITIGNINYIIQNSFTRLLYCFITFNNSSCINVNKIIHFIK